jgi:hypothetical protein
VASRLPPRRQLDGRVFRTFAVVDGRSDARPAGSPCGHVSLDVGRSESCVLFRYVRRRRAIGAQHDRRDATLWEVRSPFWFDDARERWRVGGGVSSRLTEQPSAARDGDKRTSSNSQLRAALGLAQLESRRWLVCTKEGEANRSRCDSALRSVDESSRDPCHVVSAALPGAGRRL